MLEDYEKKRDFARTHEPGPSSGRPPAGSLRFVVQKHAARRLHYDFRLEWDGVLKSWAVPKGPSVDPKAKRLAVMVEDHPLDYSGYEGVIADGNYGAGQVIVWDSGTYSPDENSRLSFDDRAEAEERMRRDVEKGKLSFTLRGQKLQGSWTLVRTSRSPKDWLLIKHRDLHADPHRDVLEDGRSVQCGLTLEDLKAGRLPDPARNRVLDSASDRDRILAMGKEEAFPSRLKPMLDSMADAPFSHPDWLFEPKLDGFRVLAFLREGKVVLLTRNGSDITEGLLMVARELGSQPESEMVLDGEIVALGEGGLPDFARLQQSIGLEAGNVGPLQGAAAIVYYPFDLLHIDGTSLRRVPLFERKALLKQGLIAGPHVQPVEYVEADGESFFQATRGLGLEGMVAKRRDSTYGPGTRSRLWLKIKSVQDQEFVVGGYTQGTGARSATFGALLVGFYDHGELRYAGRVGSGFDNATLRELHDSLSHLHADEAPFARDPELEKGDLRWVRPELIARVKFAQWTEEGRLRAPVFLGLRPDLDPKAVQREARVVRVPMSAPESRVPADPMSGEVAAVLDQLSGSHDKYVLEVGGHRISLSNLNKVLWPEAGGSPPVTKGDMIRYYVGIAPVLLPHLRDRPLTFTRYPNGIHDKSFYQKHWAQNLPEFVETVRLFSSHNEGDGEYIMVNNLATLTWLSQLANIELHPWLSRTLREPDARHLTADFTGSVEAIDGSVLNYPDTIVFDLDPYFYSGDEKAGDEPELNRRAFYKGVEVARALREVLEQLSLSSFLKTSGRTGLHIYVPILRQYDYGVTRKTCEVIGRHLMQLRRDVTMEWTVSKRSGKIFLDHNQNTRSKNMASVYSLRPLPGAPVSTPLRWDELNDIYPTDFTMRTVPERVKLLGDLWTGILDAKHDLHRLLERAE